MELHETKRITGKNTECEDKTAKNELGDKGKVLFKEKNVLRVLTRCIQIPRLKKFLKT